MKLPDSELIIPEFLLRVMVANGIGCLDVVSITLAVIEFCPEDGKMHVRNKVIAK
ncbi:hypothetical protein P278_13050 [Zhouia amylolytica AD3]|uniref:Uncharacterized protein n=1 Tax=Zhouia amylolytica AD3 TaxID=1286632 RepID=W2UNK5_9FLAO|nr:hypothetical protein P278_13050 [Zhouia amylolytica AD3]